MADEKVQYVLSIQRVSSDGSQLKSETLASADVKLYAKRILTIPMIRQVLFPEMIAEYREHLEAGKDAPKKDEPQDKPKS